jgi:hypothetical protein
MKYSSVCSRRLDRSRGILFLPVVMLVLTSMACGLFQGGTTDGQAAKPEQLLIGKWQDDSTGRIIEYTDEVYILYDFPSPGNELHVEYSLPDDHTIQLDLEGSLPCEFSVDDDTLTITHQDGKVSTYTRID